MVQTIINVIGIAVSLLFTYQVLFAMIGLFIRPKRFEGGKDHRFAVLISARNEETVIACLIQSLKNQTYPSELVDVYVVADNCSDRTAAVARAEGAIVYERFNTEKVGKGYAMDYLLGRIQEDKGEAYYDGFMVFDADNILENNYIEEINKVFSAGYKIVTSYRNSKNFGSNWITACYGLWFLREARSLNHARMTLHTSCAVSGTGFLFHRDILKMHGGGWPFFLLTEDIEFSVASVLKGEKIGYCHHAVFYDEQPTSFTQSWNQRLRWARGILQVFGHYGGRLFCGIFRNKRQHNRFSHFDMLTNQIPLVLITLITIAGYIYTGIELTVTQGVDALWPHLMGIGMALLGAYVMFATMCFVVLITEWKMINCSGARKISAALTFPFFMAQWIMIGFVALFKKVQWIPIKHNLNRSLDEIKNDGKKS